MSEDQPKKEPRYVDFKANIKVKAGMGLGKTRHQRLIDARKEADDQQFYDQATTPSTRPPIN